MKFPSKLADNILMGVETSTKQPDACLPAGRPSEANKVDI